MVFYRLQQRMILVGIMMVPATLYAMEEQPAYWYIQTNDDHVTKISKKNIKNMIRLDMQMSEHLSCPLKAMTINRNQLCLLNDAISASKDKKIFNDFYNTLTEDSVGNLLNAASATAAAKIIYLMGSCIFPTDVQKLIIAHDKNKNNDIDVKYAFLAKIGPKKYATYTVPKFYSKAIAWHPKGIQFLSWEKDHIVVRDSNTTDIIQTFEVGAGSVLDNLPLEYNADGTFLVSKTQNTVTIWDGNKIGEKIKTFTVRGEPHVAFNPNNEQLVIGDNLKIILWNYKTDEIIEKKCPCVNVVLYHPIVGKGFITAGKGFKEQNVTWRDEKGDMVQSLSTYNNNVRCADISSDGSRIAIGHMDDGSPGLCILRDGITFQKIVDLEMSGDRSSLSLFN
jgi:hypothetical protein